MSRLFVIDDLPYRSIHPFAHREKTRPACQLISRGADDVDG
jgi:hypothetical protein